ncbi:histidine kinase [Halobacteriales archaeon SW_12_69_24]|nr:MAG: histidine kinase [Halobacteriales archaeon SW_12_69_24]
MEDIYVARLMSTDLVTARPETLVEDAARLLMDNDIGSLPIVAEDNELLGILTTTDFVTIVAHSEPKAETTVERYTTTDVVTATAQEDIRDAADRMLANDCHHLPVVDDEAGLIGMISTADLTQYLSRVETPSPA